MNAEEPIDTIPSSWEETCASEPIHTIGTVQSYGFLLVADIGSGKIVQVSSGIVAHWPGLTAATALLDAPLSDWVGGPDPLALSDLATLPEAHPVTLNARPQFEKTDPAANLAQAACWECLAHRRGQWALLEWLPGENCHNELRRQSEIFDNFGSTLQRLRHAEELGPFFDECLQVIQEFCQFDRVMIYRFLHDGAGEVIAERTRPALPTRYVGLRFPASDIPAQARALYLNNRLRVLADIEASTDSLLPPGLPDGSALDQSLCLLRGLSPVHLSYLRNMGVRATLTLSIICEGKLWGLIACHHHTPKNPPHHVREGLRQLCELLAEIVAMRVDALSNLAGMRQRVALGGVLNQFHQALILDGDIPNLLEQWLPELLKGFGATTLGVRIGTLAFVAGTGRQLGATHQILDEVEARVNRQDVSPGVQSWDQLLIGGKPALPCLPEAAGLLLARRFEEDVIFCFATRPEVVRCVRWGGNPAKETVRLPDGQVRLEPRRSFAEWQESVRGHADPWGEMEADALQSLLQILSEVNRVQVNRSLHDTLYWRAHHDFLTGLYNRRAMEDEVSRRLEDGQFNTALMLLDVDHFKHINDTYGHDVGDLVLQQLSLRLKSVMRGMDLLARLGGDEFMLLMQVVRPNPATVIALAERLHQAVQAPFEIEGKQLRIGISVGIAIPPAHGRTVGHLLRHADLALYQAKGMGRSRSVVFESAMASDQRDAYLLECDLREAVDRNQLSLVYQPKVDLLSRKVIGVEALVRWDHPTRGQNSPTTFIPMAERSNEIVRIDRWVMRHVVAEQARWRTQGLCSLPIAVNLSTADITSPNLDAYLLELLKEFEVPAEALEIEVTESCIMGELDKTQGMMRTLNKIGIVTALDDFGTGFSSLSYLRQLPLQCLKIDQSFIHSMLQDPHSEKLTQAILAMGSALQLTMVAEGIETREQMNWLLAHGCHVGQGFFFSPPVLAHDLHQVIARIELQLIP